jgi:ribosomal protein L11 methyltransferase
LDTKQETKKTWWVLEFDVDSQHEDLASWLMIHLGANGCQFIANNKGLVTLQASFEADRIAPDRLQPIYAGFDEYGLAGVAATLRINQLEEEDWLAEWKKGMTPLKLGERFLVSPPWFKGQIPEADMQGRHIIWIEPGMAFGTGFHATTQFCLGAIEKHLQPGLILDVGTGSGILAIAAAQLLPGAKIVAVEIDPVACKVAVENLELNNVEAQVQLVEGSTEKIQGQKFDAILSNLTCEDNVALLPDYAECLRAGGKAIMSGILLEKLPVIEAALSKHSFGIVEVVKNEMWAGLVVERLQPAR